MKQNGKLIGILAIVLLLLVCGGIYTAYRLHPENFIGQGEIITRGEFTAILVRDIPLDSSNTEKDPPSISDIDGHWSEKNIEALIDAGIIDPADYPDGFHPDDPITRAEIIKMLVRAEGKDEEAVNTQGHSGYEDQADIEDEDKGFVIIGREDGIIGNTNDNKIRPNDPVTKGDAEDMIDKVTPSRLSLRRPLQRRLRMQRSRVRLPEPRSSRRQPRRIRMRASLLLRQRRAIRAVVREGAHIIRLRRCGLSFLKLLIPTAKLR
jgi:hypothetical protein